MACVYQIKNLVNGKFYVGSTIRISRRRRYEHFGELQRNKHSNSHLQSAFNKYGKDSFLFIVIEEYKFPSNYSKELILDYVIGREDYYIQLLHPEYNIKVDVTGLNHNETAIEKIRKRANQEDNKKRIREIQKKAAKLRIGSHWSTEVKLGMMTTKFGKHRPIEIYHRNGFLISTCNFSPEASKITGVSRSAISNNLIGLSKSAGGFIFKYKND